MKDLKPILITVLLLMFHQTNYGQELSKQVTDFVEIQDSIVAIKNVTIIDGTGGIIKYNDIQIGRVSFLVR